jgi:Domain of unknown function (DUF4365)
MRLKQRTRQHIIADLSTNFVERQVLLCGHTAERVVPDYGIDMTIRTYNQDGEVEAGLIFVQLKATDRLRIHPTSNTIAWKIDARDLRAWLSEHLPYILVVYDAQADVAYWLYIQAFFAQQINFDIATIGKTVTVHLKREDQVTPETVQILAQYKSKVIKQMRGKINYAE